MSPRRFAPDQYVRSLWLDEALGRESEPAPPEPESLPATADVVIVGGGFTGLWTALGIKRAEPATRVVVLEGDVCGGGASGRNGGFVMTYWSKFGSLAKLCGTEQALSFAQATSDAVVQIGAFADTHGIDCEFRQEGWLWAATNSAQEDAWKATLDALATTGAEPYVELDRDAVAAYSGSPVHRAGILEPGGAVVQPALLARGMARVARELGVEIHERTPVTAVEGGTSPVVETPRGRIRAGDVVLATNAWAAAVPGLTRSLVIIASDVIATAPARERLDGIGWAPGRSISDSRRLVNYYRSTDDGRVIFGKGGGTLAVGGQVRSAFHGPSKRGDEVERQFRRAYPALWDVPVARRWRGPIDYSISGLPFFCRVPGQPRIAVGAGFSGNGVGPSYLAGKALAALVLDRDDDVTPEALRRLPGGRLPPEPFRYVGGLTVRAATARKEVAEDAERAPGVVARSVARLDPTSFVDTASPVAVGESAS